MSQIYNINNVTVNDPSQLDAFFQTFLSPSIQYSTFSYTNSNQNLTVYTNEPTYNTSTLTAITNALSSYPNPTPVSSKKAIQGNLLVPGDLITFDKNYKQPIRLPVGTQNQVLTADPTSSSGIVWKDISTDTSSGARTTSLTDANSRYLDIYSSGGGLLLTQTPASIPFNIERRKDAPTFTKQTNSVVLNEAGLYVFHLKVGINWYDQKSIPNFDGQARFSVNVATSGSATSTNLIYTQLDAVLPKEFPVGAKVTKYCQFSYSAAGGETLSINAIEVTSTNNVSIAPMSSNLIAYKPLTDPIVNDITEHVMLNDAAGNMGLTTAYQVIPLTTVVLNAGATTKTLTSQADGSILINQALNFNSFWKTGFSIRNAAINDRITIAYHIVSNTGSGFTEVPNTYRTESLTMNSTSANITANLFLLSTFSAGTSLRLEARILSNNGPGTITTVPGTSMMHSLLVNNSSTGQANIKIGKYNNPSNFSFQTNAWLDVPLSNVVSSDNQYLQNSDSTVLQTSQAGTYVINFTISASDPVGTNRGSVSSRIMLNSGNGFSEVSGSRIETYYEGTNIVASRGSCLVYIPTNGQIKLQGILNTIGPNTSAAAQTAANRTELTIVKFEKTIEPLPTITNVYGSYYSYQESTTSDVTYSTNYVTKLQLNTPNVPTGTYRIMWNYNWAMTNSVDVISVSTAIDGTEIANYSNSAVMSNADNNVTDFKTIQLNAGLHNITISWKTNNASTASYLKTTKIEFYRTF